MGNQLSVVDNMVYTLGEIQRIIDDGRLVQEIAKRWNCYGGSH
jgi:hypothetical protein